MIGTPLRAVSATGPLVWLVTRIASLVVTLLVVSALIWALTFVLPGDPAITALGASATPERAAALRTDLGLDRPLSAQYLEWLSGLLHGNWGVSLASGADIGEVLWPRLRNSALIAVPAGALACALGIPLGILAAQRHRWIGTAALAMAAVPDFVIGTCAVWLLALHLRWVPALSQLRRGQQIWERPELLLIPVLTMALVLLGWCVRTVRAVVAAHLDSPAAVAARVNGCSEAEVLRRYVLPAALAPLLQFLGWLVGGSVAATIVIERLVGYPGIGEYLVSSVGAGDLPAVAGVGVVLGGIIAAAVLLCDAAGSALDPRLRPWSVRQ